jgi:hypothetical protein
MYTQLGKGKREADKEKWTVQINSRMHRFFPNSPRKQRGTIMIVEKNTY